MKVDVTRFKVSSVRPSKRKRYGRLGAFMTAVLATLDTQTSVYVGLNGATRREVSASVAARINMTAPRRGLRGRVRQADDGVYCWVERDERRPQEDSTCDEARRGAQAAYVRGLQTIEGYVPRPQEDS